MSNGIILVIGGARSGKSDFAQELAAKLSHNITYIATAEALDEEMKVRIAKHRQSRPTSWRTIEAPLDLSEAIQSAAAQSPVILIDCMTLYINNLIMLKIGALGNKEDPEIPDEVEGEIQRNMARVIQAATDVSSVVIMVSNELGSSLAPLYHLGRFYRDVVGRINQQLARAADEVYLVCSGLSIGLKSVAVSPAKAAQRIKESSPVP